MKITEMSSKELAKMALELDDVIFKTECFGTNDLWWLAACLNELKCRGIDVSNKRTIKRLAKKED